MKPITPALLLCFGLAACVAAPSPDSEQIRITFGDSWNGYVSWTFLPGDILIRESADPGDTNLTRQGERLPPGSYAQARAAAETYMPAVTTAPPEADLDCPTDLPATYVTAVPPVAGRDTVVDHPCHDTGFGPLNRALTALVPEALR